MQLAQIGAGIAPISAITELADDDRLCSRSCENIVLEAQKEHTSGASGRHPRRKCETNDTHEGRVRIRFRIKSFKQSKRVREDLHALPSIRFLLINILVQSNPAVHG